LINVQFAPTRESAVFKGTASFIISDPQAPKVPVPLTATTVRGCLVFDPPSIDLGVAGFDSATSGYCPTPPLTVAIWDVCEGEVGVNKIGVLSLAGPSQFVLTGDHTPVEALGFCGNADYCPTPRPAVTFQVSFAPSQAGSDVVAVQVTTDEFPEPYLVPLRGEATQSLTRTDSLTARATKLDLLWVIDTGPYGDVSAQQAIAVELSDFLTFPIQNGIDLQMATTSTDVSSEPGAESGKMEPCPGCKVDGGAMQVVTLAGGAQAAASALSPLINLDAGAFSFNAFFEAPYEALSPPLLTGYNQAFYRADAALAIILVAGSNDDTSDGVYNAVVHDTSFFYAAWASMKGLQSADRFSYSSVSRGIVDSDRVRDMVHTTGGVQADLGDANWTDELNALWTRVGAQLLEYPLSGIPVPSTISLTDNGVQVPVTSSGGTTNWTYNSTSNTIRFTAAALPAEGDALQISYTLACGN
jgi:hypothetical protein